MSNLHVVYRVDHGDGADDWSTYSYPHGIYVGGSTLDEVRAEFQAAAASTIGREEITLVEHLERPLIPGAYVRIGLDRHMLDRDETAQAMRETLTVGLQRDDFQARMPLAATGDAVMIACVHSDRLRWVFGQMGDHDGIALCARGDAAGSHRPVWWSFIAGPRAVVPGGRPTESIAAAGLTADSTVIEFMNVNETATGRTLLGAAS